jgi:hypothetical protein
MSSGTDIPEVEPVETTGTSKSSGTETLKNKICLRQA